MKMPHNSPFSTSSWFSPETLPAEYRPLLILSLLEFAMYINPPLFLPCATSPEKTAWRDLFNNIHPFTAYDNSPDQLFAAIADQEILSFDRSEILYNFLKLYSSYLEKPAAPTGLFRLLAGNKNLLDPYKFCINLAKEEINQEILIQGAFFKKHRELIGFAPSTAFEAIFNLKNSMYTYYYCNVSSYRFLADLPAPANEILSICKFTFLMQTLLHNKVCGLISAFFLYSKLVSSTRGPNFEEELGRLYRQAVYDRSRKVFSVYNSELWEINSVSVQPNFQEKKIIFEKNSIN